MLGAQEYILIVLNTYYPIRPCAPTGIHASLVFVTHNYPSFLLRGSLASWSERSLFIVISELSLIIPDRLRTIIELRASKRAWSF